MGSKRPVFLLSILDPQRSLWKWALLLLAVFFLLYGGRYIYEEANRLPPDEAVKQCVLKALNAESYRFQVTAKRIQDGQETVISEINGEKSLAGPLPNKIQKAIAGFSTEAVLKALGNKLDPLVEVLTAGKIKGVVALVNCTTLRNGPHDWNTVNLTKELIKRDILVVSAGCGNHGLEVAGLCNLEAVEQAGEGLKEICKALGIPPVLSFGTCTDTGRISMLVTALANHLDLDIPELPIAVTAPEWMEQKATIDGIFALAYGTYTHLSPTPFVTGAPKLVKLLTEEVEKLTGGKIALGDDPQQVAEDIEKHIIAKRQALGLK